MRKVNVYTFAGAELTLDWACFQVFSKVTISVQCSHSVVAHYVTKKTTSLYHKATALKDENGTGRYLPRGTGSPLFCKFQWPLSSDSQFGSLARTSQPVPCASATNWPADYRFKEVKSLQAG